MTVPSHDSYLNKSEEGATTCNKDLAFRKLPHQDDFCTVLLEQLQFVNSQWCKHVMCEVIIVLFVYNLKRDLLSEYFMPAHSSAASSILVAWPPRASYSSSLTQDSGRILDLFWHQGTRNAPKGTFEEVGVDVCNHVASTQRPSVICDAFVKTRIWRY